jgi:hypothetical protein
MYNDITTSFNNHFNKTGEGALGWVKIGTVARVPLIFVSKERKTANKFVRPSDHFSIGLYTFWGQYIILGRKLFLNLDCMGIKRRRILRWFQKYKLTSVTKCTYKKLFQKKVQIVCVFGITFLVHFVTKVTIS